MKYNICYGRHAWSPCGSTNVVMYKSKSSKPVQPSAQSAENIHCKGVGGIASAPVEAVLFKVSVMLEGR